MKKRLIYFLLAGLYSCTNNPNRATEDKFLSGDYFEFSDKQNFEIYAGTDTTVVGKDGTVIQFKGKSFRQNLNGEKLVVELIEYYSLTEMLLGKLGTTSGEKLLETDGMVHICVKTDSGEKINLKDGNCVIKMPSNNIGTYLFYGEQDKNGTIDWSVGNRQPIYVDTIPMDTTVNKFIINRLGWINADKFLEFENKTDLIVELPKHQRGGVYSLVFYSYNSILPGVLNDRGQLVFKGIPVGEKVSLLGIGEKDETLFYNMLDLTTDTHGAKMPEFKGTTKDGLRDLMNEKFGNDLSSRPNPMF